MFAIRADRPVLVQQEDRRAVRTPYSEVVLVDGAPMTGHNISASGISVLLSPSLTPGDIVRVTLAGAPGSVDEVASQARVSRIESRPEGIVVGLQFIE
ncbi:MAG: PilZ domain-containing protein [Acidobacteria bacterium]|nr:PilZ domain-containing protein [Acidobacteriota bacterium]